MTSSRARGRSALALSVLAATLVLAVLGAAFTHERRRARVARSTPAVAEHLDRAGLSVSTEMVASRPPTSNAMDVIIAT